MSEKNSITLFGDLSEPANTLIKKIAEATGGIFRPWQTRRVAHAEADAEQIQALSRIETFELEKRALHRFLDEQTSHQKNIESITMQALPYVHNDASPEKIDNDWLTNFFDKCRLVTDDEMQSIWSRILAGEANEPGKFSKRTVNFMESLDKEDAQHFTNICAFNWLLDDAQPLIYDVKDKIYVDNKISFAILIHLDDIGLINFDPLARYVRERIPKTLSTKYIDTSFTFIFPKEEDNVLKVGTVLLTSVGHQLASICVPEPLDGFKEYIVQRFQKHSIEVKDAPASQ